MDKSTLNSYIYDLNLTIMDSDIKADLKEDILAQIQDMSDYINKNCLSY